MNSNSASVCKSVGVKNTQLASKSLVANESLGTSGLVQDITSTKLTCFNST